MLLAFESAARHGNFSQAARELETSQSAISRHMARLETQLGARLFERSRTGVRLTEAGRRFRDAVAVGFGALRAGAAEVTTLSDEARPEVAIACADEVSHLFLMPHYQALMEALEEHVRIRIQVHSSAMGHVPARPPADMVLAWDAGISTPGDRVVVAREALRPFCSPGYAVEHAGALKGPVAGWGTLTFLAFAVPGEGAESWKRWFTAAGRPATRLRIEEFDVYMYALEAAVAGRGLVLGWRHLIGRYVENGALVALGDGFVETARCFTAALTPEGRQRPLARACLDFFGGAP
ncbi:MAG: LysR family transcriptional regulator [Rhodospirillales bacterium]|nr:LysR family transcriptional regulator [Rhodospirillales bacterium]